jgi:protein-L-isoaspartate O-methyltransferase
MIFHFGIWEPEISYLTIELLDEGDVYVDVGANIGYDTLLASSLVGSSGKVVSIEAAPAIFAV